jgi:hypothetical protein
MRTSRTGTPSACAVAMISVLNGPSVIGVNLLNTGSMTTGKMKVSNTTSTAAPAAAQAHHQFGASRVNP